MFNSFLKRALLSITLVAIVASNATGQEMYSKAQFESFLSRLSDDEQDDFLGSIIASASDQMEPSYKTRIRFTALFNKMKLKQDEKRNLKYTIIQSMGQYQVLYWEDITKSLEKKKSYRSQKRWELEKLLLKKEMMTQERFAANQELIDSIIAGEPMNGNYVNKEFAWQMLSSRKDAVVRMKRLFN